VTPILPSSGTCWFTTSTCRLKKLISFPLSQGSWTAITIMRVAAVTDRVRPKVSVRRLDLLLADWSDSPNSTNLQAHRQKFPASIRTREFPTPVHVEYLAGTADCLRVRYSSECAETAVNTLLMIVNSATATVQGSSVSQSGAWWIFEFRYQALGSNIEQHDYI